MKNCADEAGEQTYKQEDLNNMAQLFQSGGHNKKMPWGNILPEGHNADEHNDGNLYKSVTAPAVVLLWWWWWWCRRGLVAMMTTTAVMMVFLL